MAAAKVGQQTRVKAATQEILVFRSDRKLRLAPGKSKVKST